MTATVDRMKHLFLERMEDKYNQEQYFIEGCYKNETKYSSRIALIEASLSIFFKENNYLILLGRKCPYCTVDVRRKIKLAALSDNKVGTIN